MEKNEMTQEDILQFVLPKYNEIPDVGLYLKQVVKYINETVGQWFGIAVTDTMISNYVKLHLVPNAVKKLYYRDQIASFIFIVLAKSVVSLDNLQILLKMAGEQYTVKEAYELFSSSFMKTLRNVFGSEESESPEPKDAFQALIRNVIIAIVQKYYLEKCLCELISQEK